MRTVHGLTAKILKLLTNVEKEIEKERERERERTNEYHTKALIFSLNSFSLRVR